MRTNNNGRTSVATAVTSHTTTVPRIHVETPEIDRLEKSDATNSATNVDTNPIPPRNAGAWRFATVAMNGARTDCAIAKITTATLNQERESVVKGKGR